MSDLNDIKLKKVVAYLEAGNPQKLESLAEILKAQPENHSFVREYVAAAGEKLDNPQHLVRFDRSVAKWKSAQEGGSTQEPAAPAETPKPAAKVVRPPAEDEIESEPEAAVPQPAPAPSSAAAAAPQLTGDLSNYHFRFRDANGASQDLHVVHVGSSGVVVLEAKPKVTIVEVMLAGRLVPINPELLNNKGEDAVVEVGGRNYAVATLRALVEAAQP